MLPGFPGTGAPGEGHTCQSLLGWERLRPGPRTGAAKPVGPIEKGGFPDVFVHAQWGKKTVKQLLRKQERKLTKWERERMGLKAQRGTVAFHVLFRKAGCEFQPVQRQETTLYKACMVFQLERQRSSLNTELPD